MTPTHHRPRWLERHWRPAILLALLALALVGGYAIQASYHQALEHLHTDLTRPVPTVDCGEVVPRP